MNGDTVFLAVFRDGWLVVAAGWADHAASGPTTARCREAEMRGMFVLCLTMVVGAGLSYFIAIGLLQR